MVAGAWLLKGISLNDLYESLSCPESLWLLLINKQGQPGFILIIWSIPMYSNIIQPVLARWLERLNPSHTHTHAQHA